LDSGCRSKKKLGSCARAKPKTKEERNPQSDKQKLVSNRATIMTAHTSLDRQLELKGNRIGSKRLRQGQGISISDEGWLKGTEVRQIVFFVISKKRTREKTGVTPSIITKADPGKTG